MSDNGSKALVALHRHWIVADSVRVVLQQKTITPEREELQLQKFGPDYVAFGEHASMLCRMQVWYSLLYVVIEGYRALGQKYEPLEKVLAQDEYVDLLRRYRNATFHYQTDPFNDKLLDFLDRKGSEFWIGELNRQLEAFLMQALPIKEALGKLERDGVPNIPIGTKLSALVRRGKE